MEISQVSFSGHRLREAGAHSRFQGLGSIFIQKFLLKTPHFQENWEILKIWDWFRGKRAGDSFLLGIFWIRGAKIFLRDFSRVSVVLLARECRKNLRKKNNGKPCGKTRNNPRYWKQNLYFSYFSQSWGRWDPWKHFPGKNFPGFFVQKVWEAKERVGERKKGMA